MKFIMEIVAVIVAFYRNVLLHSGYFVVLVAGVLCLVVVLIRKFMKRA
jgi:hypothetical protein